MVFLAHHRRKSTGLEAFSGNRRRCQESTQSWREVLLKLKSRSMNSPEPALGDSARGFWAAIDEIHPDTAQQRRIDSPKILLLK